ncbi:MAG: prepilin-type N-terminal cleavage/methylation domain-containing protein [Acidobacteria bacterium]|nr:prepilin-type N-terminal cleavage/methylation domain-containing protein [Acidobacteriota bacterium]
MARVRNQEGFSLIELMIVVAIALIIVAFAVPQITETVRNYRLAGDARNIKSEILLAKMRAAARFTRSRVRADFNARTYQTDIWNKTTSTWDPVAVGAPQILSQGVSYGVAGMTNPPPDTQMVLGQAPECTAGDTDDPGGGGDMADTACIHFNSRGFPVDASGAATAEGAIYITSGTVVEGVTVSINGIGRIWRGDSSATDYWIRR